MQEKFLENAYQKNKYLALMALCLGFFMVIMDVTIVNVALPSMAVGLHGGLSWLQWVVDGYTLTFACLLLSTGHLGDKFGAKQAFLCGLVLFVLTSLGCGLAVNFGQLIIFRLLQGIAAALLVPTSLALINISFDNQQERTKAIGIWAAIGGIAAVAGPILGGVLTAGFGWRAVFFVNIPIGIMGFLLTQKFVRAHSVGNKKSSIDIYGQFLCMCSIAALAFGLIEAGRFGWLDPLVISGFVIFLLTFIAFLIAEYIAADPMLPVELFRSRTFSVAIAVGMILNIGVYGQLFVLTFYFQHIRDYSVLITGFAFTPLLGVMAIGSYLSGKMISVIGLKIPMMLGLVMATVGFLLMLMAGSQTPYIKLILPLAAIGLGASFIMPAATVAVIHSVSNTRAGIASGALNASRQIGSLIGVAVFGTIINTSKDFLHGMHITLAIGILVFASGFLAVAVLVRNAE